MNIGLENLKKSINHIKVLHDLFMNDENFNLPEDQNDFDIYREDLDALMNSFSEIEVFEQLYNQQGRQMVLADIVEYMLLGRGFYAIGNSRSDTQSKQRFIKGCCILLIF